MTLTLRPAGPGDERRLLLWRNDAATRRASFVEDEVAPETHRAWLAQRVADSDCALLIAEEGDAPVAQVRLDRVGSDLAEIHVTVAPEARGRGLARAVIDAATTAAPSLLGVSEVLARVKADNTASLRAFRAAGYRDRGTVDGAVELRR